MVMELIQQQAPNLAGSIQSGFQMGMQARENNLKMLASEQEINQKNQLQSLYKLAATGNPQATKQLAIVSPQAYEGLQKYQTYKIQRGSQMFGSVLNTPLPHRPEEWKTTIAEFKKEFGENPNIADEWSPEAEQHLRALVTQARQVEDVAKEQYEAPKFQADVANIKARTASEYVQQQKTKADTAKIYEDLAVSRTERQAAGREGLTLEAFKEQQKKIGQNRGERIVNLPKVEAQAEQALKLIDDVVSHKGKSAMVGVKNPFMGALPFTKQATVAGTPAAGFMAKFNQLKGKQFLEAYETLKGGGAISEIEGKKATDAISAMDLATSEAEFDQAAQDLKDVIRTGLERLKQGIKVNQSVGSQNMSQMPRIGETIDGFTFLGGNPASQQNWRQQ